MNGRFLIPANSKKSILILGLFTPFDLILFVFGIITTLLLLLILPLEDTEWVILAVAPVLITGFLVMPIPNYHNTLTFLKSMYIFFTTRQKFVWKGWCFLDEFNKQEKK